MLQAPWAALVLLAVLRIQEPRLITGERSVADLAPGDEGAVFALEVEDLAPLSLGGWSHNTDLALSVESSSGVVLARDEDGGIATNPWLCWTPPAAGTYRVRLTGRANRPVKLGVRVLLGLLDPAPPEPELAERAYWEVALLHGRRAGDEERAREAAQRLVELGAGKSPEAVLASLSRWEPQVSSFLGCIQRSTAAANESRFQEARELLLEADKLLASFADAAPFVASITFADLAPAAKLAGSDLELKALRVLVDTYGRIRPEHDRELMQAQQNLAVKLTDAGDLAAARALDERLLAVCQRVLPPDCNQTLVVMNNLAFKLKALGDLRGSLWLEEQALAARARISTGDDPELARARHNLGCTLKSLGGTARATTLFQSVLESWTRTRDPEDSLLLQLQIDLAKERGSFEEALGYAQRSVEAAQRRLPECHPDILYAQADVALILAKLGRAQEAERLHEEILKGREAFFPEGNPFLQNSIGNLVWAAHRRGDAEARDRLLRRLCLGGARALEMGRTLSWREGIAAANDQAWELMTAVSLVPPADSDLQALLFRWLETRRALAVRYRFLAGASDDEVTLRLREAVLESRKNCAALIEQAREGPAVGSDALGSAARERDAAEHRWALHAQALAPPAIRVETVAKALPSGCAAVGWLRQMVADPAPAGDRFLGEERFLAHVIQPDGRCQRLDLGPAREMEQAVERWRGALGAPLRGGRREIASAEERRAAGEHLRALALDPILAATGDVSALVVCPDDVLHSVPLDCLPLGEACVGDRLAIHRVLSLDELLVYEDTQGRSKQPRLLAVGGIEFAAAALSTLTTSASTRGQEGFSPLPETAGEVEEIAALFASVFARPADLLKEAKATVSAFQRAAPGATYLHVATHAWFEQPRGDEGAFLSSASHLSPLTLSGLAFAGAARERNAVGEPSGVLLAEELAALDLRACELAVLSACQSHAGLHWAGRGIASLHAALAAAGVRSTVTTFWPVADDHARRLMSVFYEGLWRERLSPSVALWKARTTLRAQRVPEREWAAFVLTGALR